MKKEIWRDVIDFIGYYQVSSLGRIKSLSRKAATQNNTFRVTKEKILRPNIKRGYLYIDLCKNNKYRHKLVSRLVAIAFIPNPKNKRCVCHKDDDPLNNAADNLFWGTHKDNSNDARDKGRLLLGEKTNNVILNEELVLFIRELNNNGFRYNEIAKLLCIKYHCIFSVCKRKNWKHL